MPGWTPFAAPSQFSQYPWRTLPDGLGFVGHVSPGAGVVGGGVVGGGVVGGGVVGGGVVGGGVVGGGVVGGGVVGVGLLPPGPVSDTSSA